ncbi:MAG: hypothetical protein ACR2JY_00825 [Chloroflexota bacterium]
MLTRAARPRPTQRGGAPEHGGEGSRAISSSKRLLLHLGPVAPPAPRRHGPLRWTLFSPRVRASVPDMVLPGGAAAVTTPDTPGDREALGALYDRYGGIAYTLACRMLGDRLAAAAAVEAVFLALGQRSSRPDDGPDSIERWVVTAIRARCLAVQRGSSPSADGNSTPLQPAVRADNMAGGGERSDAVRSRQAWAASLEELRVPLELAYFDGWSVTQIAAHQQLAPATVCQRLRRAIDDLAGSSAATPEVGAARR